jgi:hypothetical protein
MNDDLTTLLNTISSLKLGARKRSVLLNYCNKNNIPEWKMWKKIAENGLGNSNTKNYLHNSIFLSRNHYRKKIINLLPDAEFMVKQDFLALLAIEHTFLMKVLTLLDWALSEFLTSPFKYYNPIHGEKVLDTLIDKLGEECESLFEDAIIIPIRVVKDRYIKKVSKVVHKKM